MVAFVYVVSGARGALCVDVTLSLMRSMWAYKTGGDPESVPSPKSDRLVYYERCHNIRDAYARKDELIGLSRQSLACIIERRNPGWDDLSAPWFPIAAKGGFIPTHPVVGSRSHRPTVH